MGREPLGPPPGGGVPPRPGDPAQPGVGAPDEPGGPAWPERVEDQIRKLKQLAAVLGLLAVIATGLALWALLDNGDEEESRPASRAQVSRLDDRVDKLENQVGDASDKSDVSQLQEDLRGKANQDDVESLQSDVQDLRQAVEEAGQGDDETQAIDELSSRVDQLEQDLEELQQNQQQTP